MKKKMILAIAALMVFGLSIAAFAFTRTTLSSSTSISCCCCSGDSCPMKKKDPSSKETASCCDTCDCCKGDSCPMKKKGDATDKAKEKPATDSPEMKNVVFVQGDGCCCSCCKKDKEKKDTPAV